MKKEAEIQSVIPYHANLSANARWLLTNKHTSFSQRWQKYIFTCRKYFVYLNNRLRLTLWWKGPPQRGHNRDDILITIINIFRPVYTWFRCCRLTGYTFFWRNGRRNKFWPAKKIIHTLKTSYAWCGNGKLLYIYSTVGMAYQKKRLFLPCADLED